MKTTPRRAATSFALAILCALIFAPAGTAQAKPADDATVYYGGKKRVHITGCRRLTKDPAELAKMTKMTYQEAQAKGLPLCSKCPGSTTDRNKPGSGSQATHGPDTTVYGGPNGKRVHVVGCRRLTKDPAELAKMLKMTLAEAEAKGRPLCSKCPGSTTDQNKPASGGANEPDDNATVYYGGKKRVHITGCRRLTKDPAELAKMTKMTYGEAKAKGLPLCSRCPGSTTQGRGNPPDSWVNPAPDKVVQRTFQPDERAPLVSMGGDGRLVYKPYSDKGDRVLDWSYCGYKRSEAPIPDVPWALTLEPLPGEATQIENMAYPQGPDSTKRIQDALDKVADMTPGDDGFRGAVLLKKGAYYLTGTLTVPSGVVLRGEGDGTDGTVLIAQRTGPEKRQVMIQVGNPDGSFDHGNADQAVRITDQYVPTGSTELTLENANSFKPGDLICIKKTVNKKWIDDLGMGERLRHIRGGAEGLKKRPWKPSSYQFRHIRKIAQVNGNRITLDVMLPQSFAAEHGGGEVYQVNDDSLATQCGVESLRVVSNYDTTVQDKGKSSDFKNYRTGIRVRGTSHSWVRDCSVLHISFAAVQADDHTRHVTVRDCKYLEPVGPKRGGNRYAFSVGGGTLHLFYNCYAEDGRHDFVGSSRTMGPFAFVKCTAVRGGQSEPHHRWGTGYLFDSVTTRDGNLAAINRGDSGSGHGWAAANTMIWNGDAKNIVVFDPETAGENNFAIGYRGSIEGEHDTRGLFYANTRSGYWGTPREGKYFGYALMGSGHIESPGGPVKPESLFMQQLKDRIGAANAKRVMD